MSSFCLEYQLHNCVCIVLCMVVFSSSSNIRMMDYPQGLLKSLGKVGGGCRFRMQNFVPSRKHTDNCKLELRKLVNYLFG